MSDKLKRHPLGFLQLKDLPSKEELEQYYVAKYYQQNKSSYQKSYSKDELKWIETRNQKIRLVLDEQLGTKNSKRLLDVGCGEGFALGYFKNLGWDVTGLDYSATGLEQHNSSLRNCLLTGDIFELLNDQIQNGLDYEVILLNNVLEHVLDPIGTLQTLKHLMANSGICVVTVPNDGSEYQHQLLEMSSIKTNFWICMPDHISYFTNESLRSLAEFCGWQCCRLLSDFPIDWYIPNQESNYIEHPEKGSAAHEARVFLECMHFETNPRQALALYEALAELGQGRNLTAFLMSK